MNIVLFSEDEWGKDLNPDDYRAVHICTQLRLHKGDRFRVGFIARGTAHARLLNEPHLGQVIKIEFPEELSKRTFPRVHLLIGQPRPPVFRRLLKDLASMGIARISWLHTDLTEKSYFSSSSWEAERTQGQLRRGLEQGAHTSMPILDKYYSLQPCFKELGSSTALRVILHPGEKTHGKHQPPEAQQPPGAHRPLHCIIAENLKNPEDPQSPSIVIAIGPERGWTGEELRMFMEEEFIPAHLGSAVMRTETASVLAGGMAMLYAGGDA